MQQLKRDDPDEYAKRIHAFIDEHELVKSHQLGPTQVAMLEQLLSALPRTKARRPVMTKATAHADNSPEPWNYEPNERGLNQFLHSPQMKALEHSRPALWREHPMKFFSELVPAPMPGEVSVRRMALESLCPDDPRQSTVAKAIAQAGRLTTGQSVLVSNFGSSIGDPSVWLRR
jgi:hypothetical protein